MTTTFPTSLDTLTNPTPNDKVDVVSHSEQHANANDAIEALEAKVGADSSAVNTSHDFKLSEVPTGDKAVSKTATQTLTNKTLTSPVVNTPDINTPDIDGGTIDGATLGPTTMALGSDAEGDIYYRNAAGALTRLPRGTNAQILTLVAGVPTWQSVTPGSTTVVTGTGTTLALTTSGAERVVVFAKGNIRIALNGATSTFAELRYDGVLKDTVRTNGDTDGVDGSDAFNLMYTEVPTAGTRNITVEIINGGTLENVVITVLKIS